MDNMKLCACGHAAHFHMLLGPCSVNPGLSDMTRCKCPQYVFEEEYLQESDIMCECVFSHIDFFFKFICLDKCSCHDVREKDGQ